MRNTEIGAVIGLSQLSRLDAMIEKRTKNQSLFFDLIDKDHYETNFLFEGSSNYAFNLLLKNKDQKLMNRLIELLNHNNIEFRRGSAGGGNQLRQPYLKKLVNENEFKKYPNTEHVHFFGMYIGNFPDLSENEIRFICQVINKATLK